MLTSFVNVYRIPFLSPSLHLHLHLSSLKLMTSRARALKTDRCSSFLFYFFVVVVVFVHFQHSSFVSYRDKNGQMTNEIECSTWVTLEFHLIYFMRGTFQETITEGCTENAGEKSYNYTIWWSNNTKKVVSDFPFLQWNRWINTFKSSRMTKPSNKLSSLILSSGKGFGFGYNFDAMRQ